MQRVARVCQRQLILVETCERIDIQLFGHDDRNISHSFWDEVKKEKKLSYRKQMAHQRQRLTVYETRQSAITDFALVCNLAAPPGEFR